MKPGGKFLFSDFRDAGAEIEQMRQDMRNSGMKALQERNITPNVVKSLDQDHARKVTLIQEYVPSFLQGFVAMFIGTKGSRTYNSFKNRDWQYYSYVMLKE